MLADERLQDRREAEIAQRRNLLLLSAALAQMQLGDLFVDHLGEMDGRRVGTVLTLHAVTCREGWLIAQLISS